MPARTNDFQELITLLTQILGKEVATPSAMLNDTILNVPREVDICVHGKVSGYEVLVGIECRAWKNPQSVEWVEAMYGKHSHLPTSKLILVSASGFTKSALRLAEFLNIEAITPGEVTPGFIGKVVNNLDSVWAKRFDFTPETTTMVFDPPIECEDGEVADRMCAFAELQLYFEDKTPIATAGQFVQSQMTNINLDQPSFRDATGDETHFTSVNDDPRVNGEQIYLMSGEGPEPPNVLRRITRVETVGKLVAGVAEMPLKHGQYQGTPYSTGVAELGDSSYHWVVTEGDDGVQVGSRSLPLPESRK